MQFARRLGIKKLGLAFCVGLREEAKSLTRILEANGFELASACCKTGSILKSNIGVSDAEQVRPGSYEPMCNPIGQAMAVQQRWNRLEYRFWAVRRPRLPVHQALRGARYLPGREGQGAGSQPYRRDLRLSRLLQEGALRAPSTGRRVGFRHGDASREASPSPLPLFAQIGRSSHLPQGVVPIHPRVAAG